MKKIEKKLNNFLKAIEKHDMERLKKPMILIMLILFFTFAAYVQVFLYQVKQLKTEIAIQEPNYELENKINNLVKGHPIENMTSQIARKDKVLAAYLVAIAKKESNWGERIPVLNGEDCYNYWGYRGIREKMGSGGHTCFNSPTDAVNTVSKRLSYFIREKGLNEPQDLVVWKCGSSCAGHDSRGVQKWVQDVDYYYKKIVN